MKLLKQTLFLMVAATSVCASAYKKDPVFLDARRNGGMTQIILHVRDDLGEPIVGTEVKVRMGMTFAEKSYDISGRTDTGGVFVINGKTTGNEIGMSLCWDGNPTLRLYSVINQTPNDTNLEDDELYQRCKRLRDR